LEQGLLLVSGPPGSTRFLTWDDRLQLTREWSAQGTRQGADAPADVHPLGVCLPSLRLRDDTCWRIEYSGPPNRKGTRPGSRCWSATTAFLAVQRVAANPWPRSSHKRPWEKTRIRNSCMCLCNAASNMADRADSMSALPEELHFPVHTFRLSLKGEP
jgi:hypothetical protein